MRKSTAVCPEDSTHIKLAARKSNSTRMKIIISEWKFPYDKCLVFSLKVHPRLDFIFISLKIIRIRKMFQTFRRYTLYIYFKCTLISCGPVQLQCCRAEWLPHCFSNSLCLNFRAIRLHSLSSGWLPHFLKLVCLCFRLLRLHCYW